VRDHLNIVASPASKQISHGDAFPKKFSDSYGIGRRLVHYFNRISSEEKSLNDSQHKIEGFVICRRFFPPARCFAAQLAPTKNGPLLENVTWITGPTMGNMPQRNPGNGSLLDATLYAYVPVG
jgi:hypothetical protein